MGRVLILRCARCGANYSPSSSPASRWFKNSDGDWLHLCDDGTVGKGENTPMDADKGENVVRDVDPDAGRGGAAAAVDREIVSEIARKISGYIDGRAQK